MSRARKHATADRKPEIRLRPACARDYEFARTLYVDGARPHLMKLGRWDEETVMARFARSFNPEQAQVICEGEEEIGWMQVSENGETFHIHQIHLLEPFRRRGIGSQLIQDLFQRAMRAGKPVALNVIIGNPAQGLYERLGFKVTGGDEDVVRMGWQAKDAEPTPPCPPKPAPRSRQRT